MNKLIQWHKNYYYNLLEKWNLSSYQVAWASWFKGIIFGIIIMLLMGIPISGLFYLGTKIGYEGFGTLWSVRLLGFATSMVTFPAMTWLYLGEMITLKAGISILLAIIIMLLQLI